MNKINMKKWIAAASLFICLMAGGVSVYANEGTTKESEVEVSNDEDDSKEQYNEGENPDTQDDESAEQEENTLPEGNLSMAEDIVSEDGTREFITVYSKEGDYFYIVIDRSDTGTGNVYFLNMVDNSDLYSLTGEYESSEGIENADEVCTCIDKCTVGNVNESCSVCALNMDKCEGIEKETLTGSENISEEPEAEKLQTNFVVLAVGCAALVILLILYFAKFRKPKNNAVIEDYYADDISSDEEDADETTDTEDK